MDVDLSTDLNALLPLVAPLLSGHSDVAIGTRLAPGRGWSAGPSARSSRAATTCCCAPPSAPSSPTRSAGSRRCAPTRPGSCCRWSRTGAGSSTPSCWCSPSGPGCASTRCRWTGSTTRTRGSTSSTPRSATCAGSTRVGLGLARGTIKVPRLRERASAPPAASRGLAWQVPRFAAIGVLSTLAYIVVFLALRGFMGAQAANALSLLLTAVVNTAANRRLTFGVRGRAGAAAHHFRGLIAFGVCLVLTSGALLACTRCRLRPGAGSRSPCSSPRTSSRPRCASSCTAAGCSPNPHRRPPPR